MKNQTEDIGLFVYLLLYKDTGLYPICGKCQWSWNSKQFLLPAEEKSILKQIFSWLFYYIIKIHHSISATFCTELRFPKITADIFKKWKETQEYKAKCCKLFGFLKRTSVKRPVIETSHPHTNQSTRERRKLHLRRGLHDSGRLEEQIWVIFLMAV